METMTEFSDSGSLASHEETLSTKLAAKIRADLGTKTISVQSTERLQLTLAEKFKDFAIHIAQDTAGQCGRDTMYYVYKNAE